MVCSDGEGSGMGAYFVLKVAAAGWHSAALVLVDEDKAERVRQQYVKKPNGGQDVGEGTIRGEGESGRSESVASDETVEAPWDQLTDALHRVGEWVWGMVCQPPFLHSLCQKVGWLGHRVFAALSRNAAAAACPPGLLDKLSGALFPLAEYLGGGTASADDVVHTQGRRFLGLEQRDELAEAADASAEIQYSWEEDELPLLGLGDAGSG